MMQQELWAAEIAIPQPAIDARASMTLLANPMMKNAAKAIEEMKKVKGFPLAESTTVKIMGKTKTNGKEATEVKTSAIPASVFALPAGAKKVESPFAKMMKSGSSDGRRRLHRAGWPQHLGDDGVRVADVRWYLDPARVGRAAYAAGHIPGAVFFDVDRDLSSPGGRRGGPLGRHPWPTPERIQDVMSAAGIGPDTCVVAYDDQSGATAARLWFVLRAHGHDRAAVLDGGLAKWLGRRPPARRPTFRPTRRARSRRGCGPSCSRREEELRGRRPAGPRRARARALSRRDGAHRPARGPRPRAP